MQVILLLNISAIRSFSLVNLTFSIFGFPIDKSYCRVEFSIYDEMKYIFLLLRGYIKSCFRRDGIRCQARHIANISGCFLQNLGYVPPKKKLWRLFTTELIYSLHCKKIHVLKLISSWCDLHWPQLLLPYALAFIHRLELKTIPSCS